ncbi:MAG: aminotransferase class III-fold pyridoxal phosphate-dependent enzyme [Candidatus Riflebacteria bacterium]|nr:aminotransferase class III-fold pyridoxal phosphate-dependent enzyme [Candidatus Riflebacteria bacterium]
MKPELFHFVRRYHEGKMSAERAENCTIYSSDGKAYLDAYAGVASVAVGHCNPEVNSAVIAQIGKIGHCSNIYESDIQRRYMQALSKELPENLSRYFFVNSGSEACDFACQTMRTRSGKPLIVAFSDGFHGGTYLSKSVTGLDMWKPAVFEDDRVIFAPTPNCRECPEGNFNSRLKRCIPGSSVCSGVCLVPAEEMVQRKQGQICGFILEPVLGVGGIITPQQGFFQRLGNIVEKHNLILTVDEVQTGFGRLGGKLFGFQKHELKPDIVCMAKGIANGFPMGLVVSDEKTSLAMSGKFNFSTFGGNPVSCSAAIATLEFIKKNSLIENAAATGEKLMASLSEKLSDIEKCIEIRGEGLMIGIETDSNETANTVMAGCFEKLLLIGIGGNKRNILRIEPPLLFSPDMADKAANIISEVFHSPIVCQT